MYKPRNHHIVARRQALNKGLEEEGCGALPSTNSTLFLALRAVNIERLQES